jgi:hypothetical protein
MFLMANNTSKPLTELYLGPKIGSAGPNKITYFCENCLDYFVLSDGSCRKKRLWKIVKIGTLLYTYNEEETKKQNESVQR